MNHKCIEISLFSKMWRKIYTQKEKYNEEIEEIHERNLQNSRLSRTILMVTTQFEGELKMLVLSGKQRVRD